MRTFYGATLLLAGLSLLAAPAAYADELFHLDEELGEPFDLSDSMFGDEADFDLGGWVQFGYHSRSTGLFNRHPDRFNNHQTWLYLERATDGSEGLDVGGRFDLMYGVDAADTQSFGNNPGNWDFMNGFDHGIYGWAVPQAYLEVAYGDLKVKGGHFYTLLGYEVVQAPGNFFYSHAFTQYLSEAFTHTGVLASYTVNENVTGHAGWTAGWDTGFDQFDEGSSFLGGASVTVMEDITATYIVTAGNFGAIGDGYSHSIVISAALTDDLTYVFQSDVLHTNQNNFGAAIPLGDTTNTVGINQYLIYAISERLGIGGRAEWWKADGVSYYELTAGLNIKPHANFVIRPEIRYQWSPSANGFSGINSVKNPVGLPVDEGAIFGIDAILVF
jgi:hypothetical protein